MLALLPLSCFLFLWLALLRRGRERDARAAFLGAAVAWGSLVAGFTEGLSLWQGLTAPALLLCWSCATLAAAVLACGPGGQKGEPAPLRRRWPGPLELALGACVSVILGVTFVIALWAPPTTWDSMTYHLGRLIHWMQNRSVAFYPTHIPRQLYMPPWAEYALLHLHLLAGSDRLANLVQWFSMAGSVLGVSLIARQLGAGPLGQLFSSLLCATLPLGILQASSTQNDYVLAFWLVCLTHLLLRLRANPSWSCALAAGASLGLALLTKGTAYLFAAPLLACLLAAAFLPAGNVLRAGLRLVLLLLVALAFNLPHSSRNYRLCGSALGPGREGPPGQYEYSNQVYSASVLASNVLRNVALELRTPWPRLNYSLEKRVIKWHRRLGLGVNDPRTTWTGAAFGVASADPFDARDVLARHEDYAVNLPHLLLLALSGVVAAAVWFAASRRAILGGAAPCPGEGSAKPQAANSEVCRLRLSGATPERLAGPILGLSAALGLGFLLFCLLLRWQPWHTRLHLPLFVLCAPLLALGLGRSRVVVAAVAVLLMVWARPFLVANTSRSLTQEPSVVRTRRRDQYFRHRHDLRLPFLRAARFVKAHGCKEIGWVCDANDWEYAFWMLLGTRRGQRCRLEPVAVRNPSAALARPDPARFRPDVVVTVNQGAAPRWALDGWAYVRALNADMVTVYVRSAERR